MGCQREGFNRDPNNCAIFYQCVNNGQGGWTVYTNTCPSGLFFDLNSNTCTWPDLVEGCGASATTTTTAAPAPSTTAAPAPSTSVAPGPVTTTTPIVTDAPSTDNCVPSTTTIISTPPPTPPTPGTTLVPHPICTSDGYFREPSDCACSTSASPIRSVAGPCTRTGVRLALFSTRARCHAPGPTWCPVARTTPHLNKIKGTN